MHTRLWLGVAALPFLAQSDGCSQQDVTNIILVMVQSLVTSLIPILIQALLGGTTTGF